MRKYAARSGRREPEEDETYIPGHRDPEPEWSTRSATLGEQTAFIGNALASTSTRFGVIRVKCCG
jgi:hypothetical protein